MEEGAHNPQACLTLGRPAVEEGSHNFPSLAHQDLSGPEQYSHGRGGYSFSHLAPWDLSDPV